MTPSDEVPEAGNGSMRAAGARHLPGATRAHALPPQQKLRVTLVLHPARRDAHHLQHPAHPAERAPHSADDLAAWYDPGEKSIAIVREFARVAGLHVVESSRARHDVVLEGAVADVGSAFGVELHHYDHERGRHRGHDGALTIPAALRDVCAAVVGLDDMPLHSPRLAAGAPRQVITPGQLESHYAFPVADARRERIAILEFGGGFRHGDITAYAKQHDVAMPHLREVLLEGADGKKAANAPLAAKEAAAVAKAWTAGESFQEMGRQFGASLPAFMETMEVTMDVQLAVALGAGAAIDVYFAPAGVDGWRRAIYAAIGEPYGGVAGEVTPLPTVISISWGETESLFGAAGLEVVHNALIAAQRRGVLVCCSSGDRGSANTWPSAKSDGCVNANVNFPASSSAVVACGGTTLSAGKNTRTLGESAWKESMLGMSMASGGGMSGVFPRPDYQEAIKVRPAAGTWRADPAQKGAGGRWLPDVAASASFASGPSVLIAGEEMGAGGTSASTPICAALFARVAAATGHPLAGFLPWLYTQPPGVCRDITEGDNDACSGRVPFYRSKPGWDACTGLGAPDGDRMVAALLATAPAVASTRA